MLPLLSWLSRNALYLILAGLLLTGIATFRGCAIGSRTAQSAIDSPVLSTRQVRAWRAADRADSLAARTAARADSTARVQADSARRTARTLTRQTNALHAHLTRLPTVTPGPLSGVALRLRTYQSPDTAR